MLSVPLVARLFSKPVRGVGITQPDVFTMPATIRSLAGYVESEVEVAEVEVALFVLCVYFILHAREL